MKHSNFNMVRFPTLLLLAFFFAEFISFASSFRFHLNKAHHLKNQHHVFMSTTGLSDSKTDVIIVGGGPAGLSTAIMLSRRGYKNIRVYEKTSEPPPPYDPIWSSVDSERTYNIGISGRGQSVLKRIDAMDIVDNYSTKVLGRLYWEPDTPIEQPMELVWTNRSYVTKCLPRDCLTSCLISEIRDKYNDTIKLNFNALCFEISMFKKTNNQGNKVEACRLDLVSTKTAESIKWSDETSWVIGADGGTQSAVRDAMLKTMKGKFFAKRYEDTNPRVYRTIPMYFNKDRSGGLVTSLSTSLPPMAGLVASISGGGNRGSSSSSSNNPTTTSVVSSGGSSTVIGTVTTSLPPATTTATSAKSNSTSAHSHSHSHPANTHPNFASQLEIGIAGPIPTLTTSASTSCSTSTSTPTTTSSSSSSTSTSGSGMDMFNSNAMKKQSLPSSSSSSSRQSSSSSKWRGDLNYSARTKIDINLDALPLKNGPYLGVVLYRPWDEKFKLMKTGADARAFFDKVFPMFSPLILDQDCEIFAKKQDSKLPVFSYAGPILHKGSSMCLIGDTIHTVKPYFGLGLNSALEDVKVLEDALDRHKDHVGKALKTYSQTRAKEAKALVKMSKSLDGGVLTFVLPLILDSMLHSKLPFLFNPNMITLLQNEKLTFTQVQFRKRRDRFLQLLLFCGIGFILRQFYFTMLQGITALLLWKSKIALPKITISPKRFL